MKREFLLLFLLVGVVILSGCIGQGPAITMDGIVIKDFSFDYSPIYAEDEVGLTLQIQNIGGETGELKEISIYGVEFNPGDDAGKLTWGDKGYDLTKQYGPGEIRLLPPDPTIDFEGQTYSEFWIFQAPKNIKTQRTDDFEVRVKYGYSTTFSGTITVIESSYLRTISQEERDKLTKQGGVIESTTTSGPMSVKALSGEHYIVRSTEEKTKTIHFKVKNDGRGFPYLDPMTENLHKVSVTDWKGLESCDPTVYLSALGKSGQFSCKIKIPGTGDIVNKVDKKFSIKLDYNYYVNSVESITVNPLFEEEEVVDTTPPTVTVSHSPDSPSSADDINFTAHASDNVGVSSISISIDGTEVKSCSYSPVVSSATCEHTTKLDTGDHSYFANATDTADNIESSDTKSVTVT